MSNTLRDHPPIHPPSQQRRINESVYVEYADTNIYLWHWCTNVGDGSIPDRWVCAGTGNHSITFSPEGVTFYPSVFMKECCGMHGWIINSVWSLSG